MGHNCCKEKITKRKHIALLLVGLDNAGKTVAAKGLAGEKINSPIPTVGFSIIELKYANHDVKIFDLGGGPNIRGIWHKYFVDVHGIIFVVDSCDTDRFREVHNVLEDILCNEKIMGKPLLILANKQDKENALDEIDVIESLEIETLANKYKCPTLVQQCAANDTNYQKIDPGIREGYEWIMNYVIRNYEKLDVRVQIDVIDQELKEKEELLEKIARIRAERQEVQMQTDPDAIETYSDYVSKLNGNLTKTLDLPDFYPNPEDSNTNSSNSSITFPAIYHVNTNRPTEQGRPKSAVQMVRHQLTLHSEMRRSQSAKTRRNRTAPVSLFEARRPVAGSAKEESSEVRLLRPKMNLKSAEKIFTISNKVGPGGDFLGEGIQLGRFEVKELPPVRVKSRVRVVQHQGERNGGGGMVDVDIE